MKQAKNMLRAAAFSYLFGLSVGETYPTCGDCWCVPSANGLAQCPEWQPQTDFDQSVIDTYASQTPVSILTLDCNPYENSTCTTTPAQQLLDDEEAVCGFQYQSDSCAEYTMVTYPNRKDAIMAGAMVTHTGSCGLCSTTQDLALYLTQDFTQAGKICATKGLLNEDAGLKCYTDIGLSLECAKIWNYDGIYDGKTCGATCAGDVTSPNNGPPPACALSDCLQCDEDEAGPTFTSFAGRTRRRSGLLSEIVRPCSTIARIPQHDPCPFYSNRKLE